MGYLLWREGWCVSNVVDRYTETFVFFKNVICELKLY